MNKFKKWYIYRASLDPVIGSEQGDSRPVLIISENKMNELLNCIIVAPITSRKSNRHIYPNEALIPIGTSGSAKESIILCHQIRTLDKIRLSDFYGSVNDAGVQKAVLEALRFQFGISQ